MFFMLHGLGDFLVFKGLNAMKHYSFVLAKLSYTSAEIVFKGLNAMKHCSFVLAKTKLHFSTKCFQRIKYY